ncbi:MAG: CotH kinase family protein [Leadbetterella sp.]
MLIGLNIRINYKVAVSMFQASKYLLFFAILKFNVSFSQLKINEVVPSNNKSYATELGKSYDWVELYNSGNEPIKLLNYYFSDDPQDVKRHRITDPNLQVPAKGFLILWCSDIPTNGPSHLSFGLSSTGESFIVTAPDGKTTVDRIDFNYLPQDVSLGRSPDGGGTLSYFKNTTPLKTNVGVPTFLGVTPVPLFSRTSGFASSEFALSITHPDKSVKIYFTKDGSLPDVNNLNPVYFSYKNFYPQNKGVTNTAQETSSYKTEAYTNNITINDLANKPNSASMFSSTFDETPYYLPAYRVPKAHVIKAIAVKEGYLPSDIVTHTYFVNSKSQTDESFSLISLTLNQGDLFDYTKGIYTAGKMFDDWKKANPYAVPDICTPGNYNMKGDEAEKKATFSYFEKGVLRYNSEVDIKLHGSCSRSEAQKSIRIYSRRNFDNLAFFDDYPDLFHKNIILRNGGQDQKLAFIRDVFTHEWVSQFKISTQKTKPSVVYINGEYWGIHAIRERVDNNYINRIFGVPPSNIDMVKNDWKGPLEFEYGDSKHYDMMYDFITKQDMKNSQNYTRATTWVDPENLADYQIAEIYSGNVDWPQNNMKLWRNRTDTYNPNAPYGHDGRWRYNLFDVEKNLGMFVNAAFDNFKPAIQSADNKIFSSLLKNKDFKELFINAFADKLNTVFRAEYADSLFTAMTKRYEKEMPSQIQRWKTHNNTQAWTTACGSVKRFLQERPQNMYRMLNDNLGTMNRANITLRANQSQGSIAINSIVVAKETKGIKWSGSGEWKGVYFREIPVKLRPVAKSGFLFVHWKYNNEVIKDSVIIVSLQNDKTYEAVFEKDTRLDVLPIPAVELADCGYKLTSWSNFMPDASQPKFARFVFMNESDPKTSALIAGVTSGKYNLDSKTRVTGKDTLGVSFINTSDLNEGYPATKIGGLVMAINTQNLDEAYVSWKAITHSVGTRKYGVSLKYRIGDKGVFLETNPSNTYLTSDMAGQSKSFSRIKLPEEVLGKANVQLFWQYFYTGQGSSGSRDELGLDDIVFTVKRSPQTHLTKEAEGIQLSTENLKLQELNDGPPREPSLWSVSNTVCAKQEVKIVAQGCYTGVIMWSNGKSGVSITVGEGSFKATCESACGLSQTSAAKVIKLDDKAKSPEIAGLKNSICLGESIHLTAENCPGSILWNTGQTSTQIMVTPSQNTKYTAECKVGTCSSNPSKAYDLTVGKPQKPRIYIEKIPVCKDQVLYAYAEGCLEEVHWSNGAKGQSIRISTEKVQQINLTAICKNRFCESDKSDSLKILIQDTPTYPEVKDVLLVECGEKLVDLKKAIKDTLGNSYIFGTSSNSGDKKLTNTFVEAGKYYVFAENPYGCLSKARPVYVRNKLCTSSDVSKDRNPINLAIKEIVFPADVQSGKEFAYKINIQNISTVQAQDIMLEIDLPNNLEILESQKIGVRFGKKYKLKLDPLKANEAKVLELITIKRSSKFDSVRFNVYSDTQPEEDVVDNSHTCYLNKGRNNLGLSYKIEEVKKISEQSLEVKSKITLENFSKESAKVFSIELPLVDILGGEAIDYSKKYSITGSKGIALNPEFLKTGKLNFDSLSTLSAYEKANIEFVYYLHASKFQNTNLPHHASLLQGENLEKSTSGYDADPDGDGDPFNNSEATAFEFKLSPTPVSKPLGISQAVVSKFVSSKTETIFTFLVQIKNFTQDSIANVSLENKLNQTFQGANASYSLVSMTGSKPTLLNKKFNGNNNIDLLMPNYSLKGNQTDSVFYTLKVNHKALSGNYYIQLQGKGRVGNLEVFDDSNDGLLVLPDTDEPTWIQTDQIDETERLRVLVNGGISPNGDGLNDELYAEIPEGLDIYNFTIVDEKGMTIKRFEQSDVKENRIRWDLKTQGKTLPTGTYFYFYSAQDTKFSGNGFITVIW